MGKGLENLTLRGHFEKNEQKQAAGKFNNELGIKYQLIIKRVVNDQTLLKATLN